MLTLLNFIKDMLLFAGYMGTNTSFPDPLSKEEEIRLIELCCNNNDEEARVMLIEHNLRLVSHIAKKYIKTGVELDELISIGAIGLVKAVSTFKTDKGNLCSYASRCIENEILMFLRSERKHINAEISLDEPVGRDPDGNEVTVGDRLCADDEDIQESAFRNIFREKLQNAIDTVLDGRERDVIEMRYSLNGEKPLAQREVAQKLNVSRSYISRIEKRALKKLNKALGNTF